MKIVLENISENRGAWLALRSRTIGSSEIATIVGLNKYQTPLQLWMEKTGRAPAQLDNDAMRLGRLLEQFIGEKFARDTALSVHPANVLLAHDIHESFTASPDFWVLEPAAAPGVPLDVEVLGKVSGLLECKNVNYRLAHLWENGNCPDYAQIQLQWQLAVSGLSGGYVAGLIGANTQDFHYRPFPADKTIADKLFYAADEFLGFVKSDTPPAPLAADRAHVESLLEPVPGSGFELPESALDVLRAYETCYTSRKGCENHTRIAKEAEDTLRAQLEVLFPPGASLGTCGEYSVEVSRVNKSQYVVPPSSYINFVVKKNGKRL